MILSALIPLVSCEKAVLPESKVTGNVDANLTVSVFQIEKTPFDSLTRAAPADACTRLNFAIYNQDGSRIKQVNQTSDKADFGTCSFQLDEGTYQLVVVAHSGNGNPTMTDPAKIQFTNATGYTDTFLYTSDVTIGDDHQDLAVPLKRIVALCRFVISDNIPSDVKKIQFYYTGGSGAFNSSTGLGNVASKQTVTSDVTADKKQFDLYTFPHQTLNKMNGEQNEQNEH